MYVLADVLREDDIFLSSVDREGVCYCEGLDDAMIFESRDELRAFIRFLSFYLDDVWSDLFKIIEI